MPKTILIAINDLNFGGAQRTVLEQVRALRDLGYNVHVLTLLSSADGLRDSLVLSPENMHKITFRSVTDFTAFFCLLRTIRNIRPDLILSNLFFTNTMIRLTKLFYWKPKIYIREGNVPEEKSLFVSVVDWILSSVTSKVIVNSRKLVPVFKKRIFGKTKVVAIYNGINENFFLPPGVTREEVRSKLGIPTDSFVVTNVASMTKKKGQDVLLRAVSEIHSLSVHLLLVGSGPLLEYLKDYAKKLKVDSRVHFAGPQSDVSKFLCATDVFVLSSLWEGMPNALLEAMASRLPVVATNVGGSSEVIENGKNGILVSAGNVTEIAKAIQLLHADPEFSKKLASNAEQTARSFTWEAHVNSLLSLQ